MTPTLISSHVVITRGARRTKLFSLVLAITTSACANEAEHDLSPSVALSEAEAATTEPKPASPTPTEISAPRIVTTYEGGLLVLDGRSLGVVSEVPLEGFLRLAPAGDHRHVVVSTDNAYRFLDTGVTIEEHGDHDHYYAVPPKLTDLTVTGAKPGHVTHNAGLTALFSDGSGRVELFDPKTLVSGTTRFTTYTAPAPHHGVAVALSLPKGGLLVTTGTSEKRSGAVALDAGRQPVASAENCPGVHGETIAKDGVVVLGCEDGALVYRGSAFHKVQSPDAYGRIGNQAGSSASPIVLGDYKVDRNATLERPERVALIDTQNDTLRLVKLGVSYTFRSLARGPEGEALVLGTDGAIHVIDPQTGELVDRIEVVPAWSESLDWHDPRPTIRVVGERAYVTEPAASKIHLVHLGQGKVVRSAALPHVPNELAGIEH
ncbi:MAG: zinc metallochaperone AztD [Polyangiales bacterium]